MINLEDDTLPGVKLNVINIIDADTWCGLWVNEELCYQDHEIKISDLAEFTPIGSLETSYATRSGMSLLEDEGSFSSISFTEAYTRYCTVDDDE